MSSEIANDSLRNAVLAAESCLTNSDVAKVVINALNDKNIFVFGELLSVPSVIKLQSGEYAQLYNTLELFAYGTFPDYIAGINKYIYISPESEQKLKQLTVISMAQTQKILSYSQLQQQLNLTSNRQLEELIIEAIYSGIIKAKLHPYCGEVIIEYILGRDVPLSELDSIISTLQTWKNACGTTLESLQDTSNQLMISRSEHKEFQDSHQATVTKIKSNMKDVGYAGLSYTMEVDDADAESGSVSIAVGGRTVASQASVGMAQIPISRSFKRNRGIGGTDYRNI